MKNALSMIATYRAKKQDVTMNGRASYQVFDTKPVAKISDRDASRHDTAAVFE